MTAHTAASQKYLLAFLLLSQTAIVNAVNLDAGELLNEQQRLQPGNQPKLNEPDKLEPVLEFDQNAAPDKINIKSIHFQHAEQLVGDAQLQAWVANAIGKQLSFAQLQQLTEHVTQQLRNAGYLLAKAYLPKQDVTNGVIQIIIIEGQVDKQNGVIIKGNKLRINELRLQDILEQNVRAGQALHKQALERSLLLINDLPGLSAQASLGAGQTPGTAKVTVNANEGPLLSGGVWGDNFGNHYTGNWRGNGMLNINDPFKMGDQLRLSMTGSEGILLGSARYAVPLMANGLNMEVHYSNLQYQIGRDLSALNLEGEANTVGNSFNFPFIRSRAFSLWGSAGYDHRALRDKGTNTVLSDREINEAVVSISTNSLDYWLGGGVTNSRLGMVAGNRSNDTADIKKDLLAKTQGSFAKFTYSLARLQKLNQQLSFYSTINGQQATGNLDSSEKFILGGPTGVRAYPVGEASGDHGWVINTELRWDVPYATRVGRLQMVGFIDTGHISLHDSVWAGAITSTSQKNNYQLSGGGISINLTQNNRYQISGTWAAPIGGNPGQVKGKNADGGSDSNRFWLQGMLWF